MTSSTKSSNAVPRPMVIGLLAIVAGGIVWQLMSTKPIADAPELPVLTGTTQIAQIAVPPPNVVLQGPHLVGGDLALAADGSLWTCWLEGEGIWGDLKVSRSTDQGRTFGPAETLHNPGTESLYSTPARLAVEADGDVVLVAMNHRRNVDDPSIVRGNLTVFRHASGSSNWSAFTETQTADPDRSSLFLRAVAAVGEGALVCFTRDDNVPGSGSWTRAAVAWSLQPDDVRELHLPSPMDDLNWNVECWVHAGELTLLKKPLAETALYAAHLNSGTWEFDPPTVVYTPQRGRELQDLWFRQGLDGSATLHALEVWRPVPQSLGDYERWDRLIFRGTTDGALHAPVRCMLTGSDVRLLGGELLPSGEGWLRIGKAINYADATTFAHPADQVALTIGMVSDNGEERASAAMWQLQNTNGAEFRDSVPILFPDGSGAIAVSHRSLIDKSRFDTWTLLRFAPSTSSTE